MLTRHAVSCSVLLGSVALAVSPAGAAVVPTFASAVPAGGYTRGSVFIAADTGTYSDPAAALGPVEPVISAGSAYANLYNPFNAHYEVDQLVAFGRGGSLVVQFPTAIPVVGGPQIGVFTNAGLVDADYPAGSTGGSATTFAALEYGAERTAVVEVGASLDDMRPVGRVVFSAPGNYYANATENVLPVPPSPAILADFAKPFTQSLSAFDGKDFAGVLSVLDGSAGGTWIDLPAGLGLPAISYVRFSDPLWRLADGSFAETRISTYDPTYVKPADLVIDAVVAIPEPSSATLLLMAAGAVSARRRRRAS